MEIYLANMAIVVLSGFLGSTIVKEKIVDDKRKYNWFFLIWAVISLICVSGFRYMVGTDYFEYSEIYTAFGGLPIELFGFEVGFDILSRLLYRVSSKPQFFFFVTSIIINICIITFLRRHSKNITLSLYFYITMGIYYGTMNGLRQYMASMVMALAFQHIIKPNFKKYLIHILIASLFHSTVFIMIPIYFIVTQEMFSLGNKIFLAIIAFAFVVYQPFVNIMMFFLGSSKYSGYEDVLLNDTNGANILRIIVWIIPIIIAIVFKDKGKEIYKDYYDKVVNMSMYGMCFMLLAYRQVFFARLTMYFDIYYLLLFAILPRLFDEKLRRVFTYGIVVCFFVYNMILLLSGEGNIYPYKYRFELF